MPLHSAFQPGASIFTPNFRRFALISFFIILASVSLKAQDKVFGRSIIDTLTSPYFSGRGYVCDGDKRAADFVSSKFKAFGLRPLGSNKDYFQEFSMPVNTFPGTLFVSVDGKELEAGKDYLVDPASPGVKRTTFKIISLEKSGAAAPKKKQALRYEKKTYDSLAKANALPGIIKEADLLLEIREKLIWSVCSGCELLSSPRIILREGALPENAREITVEIKQKYLQAHKASNVIGYVEGKQQPDSFIFLTAHYDHLGRMGCQAYFPGANDNASGVAMLLDLASYFSKPENRPDYSIVFVAFAAEEAGLVGSKYYTEHPLVPLNRMRFLINMDLMANGQDGMMAVNGAVYTDAFDRLESINSANHYLKEVKKRGKAANSDHYWFSEKGVPAFFFYLLGEYPHYHDIYDTAEKPTLAGYEGAFKLIVAFIDSFSAMR